MSDKNKQPQKKYGKGSKRREEDFKAVQDNWDFIDWNNKKNKKKESES